MKVQKKVIWREGHRGGFQPGDRVRISRKMRLIGRRRAVVVSSLRRLPWERVAIKLVHPLSAPDGTTMSRVWNVSVLMLKRIP